MNHYYWQIEGWFSGPQLDTYSEMVKNAKDGAHFVEIGAWKGKSTSFMGVEIANSGKKIKFDTVDTFRGSEEHQNMSCIVDGTLYQEYSNNVEPVKNYVNTIVGDSARIAENYADCSLDFVFIDGDHSYEGVKRDILAWIPKLKIGGILAGDDFSDGDFPGVSAAVGEILEDVEIYEQVWIYKVPKNIEFEIDVKTDEHLRPYNNYSLEVEGAYIISLPGNQTSEECTQRCITSLEKVGMKYYVYPGFDGTSGVLKTPEHLKGQDWLKWLKIDDHLLSTSEIGCTLSHIALWAHCVAINRPIVILEHDALMYKKYTHMPNFCCIENLGHIFWVNEYMASKNIPNTEALIDHLKTDGTAVNRNYPALNVTNENYLYQMGHHCYAIDPFAAKKMLVQFLKQGLTMPNDAMASVNNITIYGTGLYGSQDRDSFFRSTIRADFVNREDDKKFKHRKPSELIPGVSRIVKSKTVMNHPAWLSKRGE